MDWKTVATIATTVLVAFVGFVAAYLNNLRLARRKDRFDRISRQLSEFYGPLLSLVATQTATWDLFRENYRPGGPFWGGNRPPPSEQEAAIWRAWMTEVFMPLNRRIADLIHTKGELMEDMQLPSPLLAVCAHVASYEPVLKQWENGDFREHLALSLFPRRELYDYADRHYRDLRMSQQELLDQLEIRE